MLSETIFEALSICLCLCLCLGLSSTLIEYGPQQNCGNARFIAINLHQSLWDEKNNQGWQLYGKYKVFSFDRDRECISCNSFHMSCFKIVSTSHPVPQPLSLPAVQGALLLRPFRDQVEIISLFWRWKRILAASSCFPLFAGQWQGNWLYPQHARKTLHHLPTAARMDQAFVRGSQGINFKTAEGIAWKDGWIPMYASAPNAVNSTTITKVC